MRRLAAFVSTATMLTPAHAFFGSATAPGLTRMVLGIWFAIWAGGVENGVAETPTPSAEKLERITAFFDNEIATGKLPGAVVLIQQHGQPVYLKCFGVRDVTSGAPMTPDTIFPLH